MRKIGTFLILLAVFFNILICNCGTKVQYGDPAAQETLTVDFGSTDLNMIAEKMVNSMLSSPVIQERNRPILQVASIKNKTNEHIDTKSISDKIRTTLLKSGAVQFSAGEIRNEIIEELEFQRGSGYVDPSTQKRMGKQVGADFLLTGEISSIKKQKGGTKDIYFKITLNLVDLETALISWADEKEIRKRED